MQNQNPYPQQPNYPQQNPQFDPAMQMPRKSNTINTILIVVGVCFGILILLGAVGVALLLPAVKSARQAAQQNMMRNSMKQVSLAMLTYQEARKNFPPAVMLGKDGKTPLSWRVAILPYLGHQDLYNMYRQDEPWDGPNNIKLLPLMPQEYADMRAPPNTNYTNIAVITDARFGFNTTAAAKGKAAKAFPDGMSNTIMVVETNAPIPWTKPEDLTWDSLKIDSLGLADSDRVIVAMMDGALRTYQKNIPRDEFEKLLTTNGGEKMSLEKWEQ